jgi:hypothetical protein
MQGKREATCQRMMQRQHNTTKQQADLLGHAIDCRTQAEH